MAPSTSLKAMLAHSFAMKSTTALTSITTIRHVTHQVTSTIRNRGPSIKRASTLASSSYQSFLSSTGIASLAFQKQLFTTTASIPNSEFKEQLLRPEEDKVKKSLSLDERFVSDPLNNLAPSLLLDDTRSGKKDLNRGFFIRDLATGMQIMGRGEKNDEDESPEEGDEEESQDEEGEIEKANEEDKTARKLKKREGGDPVSSGPWWVW